MEEKGQEVGKTSTSLLKFTMKVFGRKIYFTSSRM